MVQLLHEVWEGAEGALTFRQASAEADAIFARIDPDARLIHTLLAAGQLEAVQAYYAWNGWGPYEPIPDFEYPVYTEEMRRQQIADGKLTD